MTMITPSYLGETIEYSSLHACRSTLEDPTGGAVAGMHGADFLCMVSPSEHLALPLVEDIVQGTRVAKIAAHIADISRTREGYKNPREMKMAQARRNLDWEEQFRLAMYGEVARDVHRRDGDIETCSMCGELCAVKLVRDIFSEKGDREK